MVNHQRFHSSIQKSAEVDRAREELVSRRHGDAITTVVGEVSDQPFISVQMKKGDRGNIYALDQEWDSLQVSQHQVLELNRSSWFLSRRRLALQKMSFGRTQQLQALQQIMLEMSKEIMWVNDREEEELVFDWGDKNIDQYIPRKQESYSVSGRGRGAPAPLRLTA